MRLKVTCSILQKKRKGTPAMNLPLPEGGARDVMSLSVGVLTLDIFTCMLA